MRVAVTGAAGQIGYSLLFRIAAGEMLGPDTPVILQMLEIEPALGALEGVAMELEDCAFPLRAGMIRTADPEEAFADADVALLVGAMPRKGGMERADLLSANGAIFTTQGRAIASAASPDCKVLVVGNPANTNALIAVNNAEGRDPANFTAMTRLDHNRAKAQLAAKTSTPVTDIKKMTIWGNHSTTQYRTSSTARWTVKRSTSSIVRGSRTTSSRPSPRGAAIIEARGARRPPAANAAISHVRDWVRGTPRVTGSRWPWCPTAPTVSRGIGLPFPCVS